MNTHELAQELLKRPNQEIALRDILPDLQGVKYCTAYVHCHDQKDPDTSVTEITVQLRDQTL